MKIERINDNQIRCTLSNFDLSVRNLNLTELAYGSEKAKNLFREMIQKASNEVGFEADDIPLMVEAIPLSNESVMLVITKMEDPEELDTRFSKFSPMSEDEDTLLDDLANELLEGADGLMQFLKDSVDAAKAIKEGGQPSELPTLATEHDHGAADDSPLNNTRIFIFPSLDAASDAAKVATIVFHGESLLYKNPKTNDYYLIIKRGEDSLEFSRICNVLAEYGNKIRHDYATEAYYEEHYELIIRRDALGVLAQL